MMIKFYIYPIKIFVILSVLFLASCGADIEDAKELGFSSAKEMVNITNQGYQTKKAYNERYKKYGFTSLKQMNLYKSHGYESMYDYQTVKKRTPGWFMYKCKNNPNYMEDCFGKRIIWMGIVVGGGADFIKIDVLDDDANSLGLRVDSKSLKKHSVRMGQLIVFHGRIDQENFITPDIERITFVRFESEENQRIREKAIDKRKKEEATKQKIKEKRDFEKNKRNAAWLMSKFELSAGLSCSSEIPKLAQYGYEWTDGILETKFYGAKNFVKAPGILTLVGNKIKFQNGFGAWKIMEYWCDYDTANKVVVDYGAN